MTDPGSQDDGWDELARELGLEKSSQSAEKAAPAPVSPPADDPELEPVGEERPARGHRRREDLAAADIEDGGLPEGEADALADDADLDQDDGEGAEGEAGDGPGGEGQPGDGQPGTGRKRRRRRRRRKKGGAAAAGEATEAGSAAGGDDEADEPAPPARPAAPAPRPAAPVRARQPEPEVAEADDDGWDTEEESAGAPLAAEEDTGGEVLRELIANWNVPSWDDIVGGLHRPER